MQKGLRFGEYVLLEKLGDGGMGEVWKAEHARMLRIEALKFLRDGAELRPEAKQRFLREAILQSRFQHPNIVAVYNAFEQDGASCIAMQFVDGESLEQRLHRLQGQLMPLPEVLEIATGVLAALEYAHTFRDLAGSGREGVIHRDVKPSNILLDRSGRALLTDFGIAFALDSNRLTQAGTTLGTVFYMSPEQIQEPSAVNVQSDIYSFGCVLYELLAGRPPFGAETDTDFTIKSMHVREMPKPLRLWNQDVPFDFEWIVYKALNKDQAMRFSSCAEMSRALTKAFVAHQAAETNAPAPTPKNGTVEQPAWEAVAPLIKGPQPPPAAATAVYTTPIASSTALLPVSSAFPPLTEKQVGQAKPILPRPLLWIGLAALLLLGVAVYVLKDALFGPSEQIVLVLKGSTSVGDELAPKMVEAFLRDELKATKTGSYIASKDDKGHPLTHIWGVVPGQSARQVIEIYATGSGDAFKCLAAAVGPKHCDLGMSSRPFSDKDRSDNPSLGNLNNPANEHIIALDGIAVIVNPANPVGRLSMQQLREIYTGQTVNWKQVGGDDAPIELYGRDQASGTREMFEQMVVGKDAQGHPRTVTVPGGHQLGESTAMVDAVLKSPNALGYVSSPLARDAKKLAISDGSAAALRPTMLAIVSEDYPIGRRLFLYEPSNPTPMAQSFVRYAVNAQGQAVVSEAHYIGLTPQAFPVNDVPPDAPSLYKDIASRYAKLGLSFRFASGKASLAANPDNQLDNLARDNLARLEAFLAQHPGVANNLLLIGFADNVGGAGLNDALAHNRANTIANSLKEDDVRVPAGNVRSLGLQMPVSSNETSEGKSRNRRVEVWVPKGTD